MHSIVEEKIKTLLRQIEEATQCNEDVILALEIVPDAYVWTDNEVNVSWRAKSMDEVKEVLAAFAKRKVMIDTFIESGTIPIWYLKGINVRIRLCPSWGEEEGEGVTCRLIQTGTETYTRPTYKLVCDEKEKKNEDPDNQK